MGLFYLAVLLMVPHVLAQDDCANFKTVPVTLQQGQTVTMYVVSQSVSGQSCKIVKRSYSQDSDQDLDVVNTYEQDGKPVTDNFKLTFLKPGYYNASKNGESALTIAYLTYDDKSAIAVICPQGGDKVLQVSSDQPLPNPDKACKVESVFDDNGLGVDQLQVVNNCDCPDCPACPETCPDPPPGGYFANC